MIVSSTWYACAASVNDILFNKSNCIGVYMSFTWKKQLNYSVTNKLIFLSTHKYF